MFPTLLAIGKLTTCRRAATTICLRPLQVDNIFVFIRQVTLFRHVGYLRHQQQVDLLTLKVVSESHVTWVTSVPILVFLGLSVLELRLMYATDVRQTPDRQTSDKNIDHRLRGSAALL